MADDTQPTEAEQAAADALAGVGAQDPTAGDSDVPTDPAPPEEVADAQEADPTSPGPDEDGNPVMPGNAISGQESTLHEGPEDPGPVDHEEAVQAAVEEAQSIAAQALENKPEPEAEPEPEPEDDEDTTFVVYKAVDGMPYPGLFLTVTIQLEDDENDEPVWETITLQERIPLEVKVSHADKLAELESEHYTIESA